jgi:leucyl-tRNA synthetase
VLLLSPITPHLCEEVWESTGNDGFICQASWPKCDEAVVSESESHKWNMLGDLGDDIKEILKVAHITSPETIHIIVAAEWKFELAAVFRQKFARTKDRGQIMKALMSTDLKRYGKQVNVILGKYLDDPSLAPSIEVDAQEEFDFLNNAVSILESNFNCAIEISSEEDSKERKAASALPGRQSIIVD